MKNAILTLVMTLIIGFSVCSQTKIVIDDQAKVLNLEIDSLITNKISETKLEYTFIVDFKQKCDYYFAKLHKIDKRHYLEITDCKEVVLGKENLGYEFNTLSNEFKAFLIAYYIKDILVEPEIEMNTNYVSISRDNNDNKMFLKPGFKNEHDSRYFFSPSSRNLKKGELYYNTIYFAIHDIQYGLSDNFSIGMGTTIGAIPFYITPKLSFPINNKNTMAIGNMFMIGTWGTDFMGNLAYTTYTRGTDKNNFTLGLGHFSSGRNDIFDYGINKLAINFSLLKQVSNYIYLVSENYLITLPTTFTATNYNTSPEFEEEFTLSDNLFLGFTGFRLINKKEDVKSWQVGLAYQMRFVEEEPSKYTTGNWYTNYPGINNMIIPMVSYTIKLGRKY